TVGEFHQLLQWQVLAYQTAKCRVQMAHQHGCRDALSRDIAKQKQKGSIGLDQVAVIAADQTCRLVVVSRLPPGDRPVRGRQERALDTRGERQVTFQSALLVAGKMIQAETQQRVAQQAVRFNGSLTGFANAESAILQPGK